MQSAVWCKCCHKYYKYFLNCHLIIRLDNSVDCTPLITPHLSRHNLHRDINSFVLVFLSGKVGYFNLIDFSLKSSHEDFFWQFKIKLLFHILQILLFDWQKCVQNFNLILSRPNFYPPPPLMWLWGKIKLFSVSVKSNLVRAIMKL